MNTIRILPKKCAAFRVKDGKDTLEHEIRPADRMILQDAPAWIQADPLFGWMVKDGSLEMVETVNKAANQPQEEEAHTSTPVDVMTLSEEQPQEDEPKKRGRRTT